MPADFAASGLMPSPLPVRAVERKSCSLCGSTGKLAYNRLTDLLFEVLGEWNIRKCGDRRCGLLWLDPEPIEEDLAGLYRKYHTHEIAPTLVSTSRWHRLIKPMIGFDRAIRDAYIARRFGYKSASTGRLWQLAYLVPTRRRSYEKTVAFLDAKRSGRLLEIGCGNGWLLSRMRKLGWRVEGVDPDPGAAQAARQHYALEVKLGTLFQQRYVTSTFDAIVMSHVIEHVPDAVAVLAECLRILKPGGKLVVVTPNAGSLGLKIFGSSWRGLEPPRHLQIFTRAALISASVRAGFHKIQARSMVCDGSILLRSYLLTKGPVVSRRAVPRTLLFEAAALIEHAILSVRPELGEELLLEAWKAS